MYTIAGVLDHRVLSNRSRAYLAMNQLDKALADADTSCELRPFRAKVGQCACHGWIILNNYS